MLVVSELLGVLDVISGEGDSLMRGLEELASDCFSWPSGETSLVCSGVKSRVGGAGESCTGERDREGEEGTRSGLAGEAGGG